jgi:sulfate/thiosulfate transport system ATP-binding protein
VSRTLPEQRDLPVTVGQRVAVGARRIHVLPTPISSFTAVAVDAGRARELQESPLLSTLGIRMQTRVAARVGSFERAPPGMPAIAVGPGCAAAAEWHLAHGAVQLLCVPTSGRLPNHVVIHTLDAESRRATLAVAASLLRHVAAEAIYLGIQPAASAEADRAEHMRELLDARSTALAHHGLDMRTELRPGTVADELQKELAAYEQSMLVLGTSNPGAIQWSWLKDLLEQAPQRAVLIVNAARAESAPEA